MSTKTSDHPRSTDPADLFCQLYDELSDYDVAEDRQWQGNDHLLALTAEVRGLALDLKLEQGWIDVRLKEIRKRSGESSEASVWAAARGLDQALRHSNPAYSRPDQPGMRPLADLVNTRYASYGRFDSGDPSIGGALLPKVACGERRGETTATRAEAFGSVHRVPDDLWTSSEVEFRRLEAKHQPDPAFRDGKQGIVVACTPLLESLQQDVHIEPLERRGRHVFSANPCEESLKPRVQEVLRRLDDSGAMLGVAPELSLSEPLLQAWRDAMTLPKPEGSRLRWVFVGSGPLGDVDPPYNCGVFLDRDNRIDFYRQAKLFPFTLDARQISDWGLSEILPRQAEEDMTRGRKLHIRDTTWGRVAVLICEDLTKLLEERVGGLVKGFGVSLLIAPVFSKEVKAHFWEHSHAKVWAEQAGARTVVANSLAVARHVDGRDKDFGTCLVSAPGGSFQLGKSRRGDQISVFWSTSQSVELPATHPVATDVRP